MTAKKMGRPSKVTPAQRKEVFKALEDYINTESDPTLVGFCAWNETAIKYSITKDNLNDWDDFSDLRKRAVTKQEAYLIKNATKNALNATVAIFRLKQPQHGYTDKHEQDITSGGNAIAPVLVRFVGDEQDEQSADNRNTD